MDHEPRIVALAREIADTPGGVEIETPTDRAAVAAYLTDQLAAAVAGLWRLYDGNPEMNDEQPQGYASRVYAASLDEWWHEIIGMRGVWRAKAVNPMVSVLDERGYPEPATPDPVTLSAFFDANADGIDHEERQTIRETLATRGNYKGGGGAAPVWNLVLAPTAPHPEETA